MMKKITKMRKIIMAAAMAGMLGLSSLLAGCGQGTAGIRPNDTSAESDKPQSVSMVLGIHDLFPVISLNTDSVYSKIYGACYTYGDFSAVVVDGAPFVACNYSISEPDKKIDHAKRKQIAKNSAEQIMTEVSGVSARTPEIDTLSAISISADTLHSTSKESDKSMIIYDSGLSTTSLLNFSAQNIIEEPADSIVAQLDERHAVPDLEGIDVTWIGLGKTCGEQTSLTPDYEYRLQNIWQGILEKGGASSVTFDTPPVSSEESSMDLPKCSTVPVVADSLEVSGAVSENEMPEVIKWDETSPLRFKADKAEFADVSAAVEQMKPVASYLNANHEEAVYVFGMTATVTGGDFGIELAEARADACKEVLMQQGVSKSQIVTVGLGQLMNPLRVNDVDADGIQIEELAQKNRAVFVVRADSELVAELMNCVSQAV